MIARMARTVGISLMFAGLATAQSPEPASEASPKTTRVVEASGRQVLVELYTSQGCNYCPVAERVLREMEAKGYGAGQVITLAFHVDYFNKPWVDPFSAREYSGRQWAYNEAFKKLDPKSPDLYFTPMVMVDGRYPMSGYHAEGTGEVWPFLKMRLDRALGSRREAGLVMSLETPANAPSHRDLTVRVRPKSSRLVGKDLLLCVAIAENPLTTAVPSGENAGATLVEGHVVRKFQFESVSLRRDGPTEATFALDLDSTWNSSRCDLVAFLQDEQTGAIYEVASMPWEKRPSDSK